MTIVEHYRADRDEAANKEGRAFVWRTYARALIHELQKRGRAGGIRWRRSRMDDDLPIPYWGYWKRVPDADLLALEDALIRARFRG